MSLITVTLNSSPTLNVITMPRFQRLEQKLLKNKGMSLVVGIDEAGRGSWAGPLSIGAVVYSLQLNKISGLNDSKLLSKKRRENLYDKITKKVLWLHEFVDVDFIDENGLTASLKHGFESLITRIEKSLNRQIDLLLIDGKQKWSLSRDSQSIIAGDSFIRSIAAASIVAKVRRDKLMHLLNAEFLGYGFADNMGYGTRSHRVGLDKYGPTPLHRLSFEPLKSML